MCPLVCSDGYPAVHLPLLWGSPQGHRYADQGSPVNTIVKIDGPEGTVAHCELSLGSVVAMLGSVDHSRKHLGSLVAGGTTGGLYIVMKDKDALEAHYQHAKATAPHIIDNDPFKTDYGSWDYSLKIENQPLYFGTYAPKADSPTE